MKAILMSIKPEYGEKILSGEKTVELRKTAPADLEFLFESDGTVYLYFAGTGMVMGEFKLNQFLNKEPDGDLDAFMAAACLTAGELKAYGPGRNGRFCGWQVKQAGTYVTPIPLSAFGLKRPPQSWCYVEKI